MGEAQATQAHPVPDNTHYATDVLIEAGRVASPGNLADGHDVIVLTVAGFQQDHAGNRIPTTTKVLFPRDFVPLLTERLADAYIIRVGA